MIIACYKKWGIDCVKRFNGMFSIALYDKNSGSLFLARDRFGKKPLYYWLDNGDLYFASELKCLFSLSFFDRTINRDCLPRFFFKQYFNSPQTVFSNVFQVRGGRIVEFNVGKVRERVYWDLTKDIRHCHQRLIKGYDESKAALRESLEESVKLRLNADVKVGTFLSGGIDSSLITAIAQKNSLEPIKTFSIGFEEKEYDESIYARKIADYLDTDHTSMVITESDMRGMVESIPKYFDEPFADASQIPTMLVSYLASKQVKVILSGDGGDEFFCGYETYDKLTVYEKLDWVTHFLREGELSKWRLPDSIKHILSNNDLRFKTQYVSKETMECLCNIFGEKNIEDVLYDESDFCFVRDWKVRRMLLDINTYLMNDILTKVDRASMKYSVEARCPLLDINVFHKAFRIPQRYKYAWGDKKHILKDIAYDYIPQRMLDRPKQGFSVPIKKWIMGPLKNELMDYIDNGFLRRQGLFNVEHTQRVIMKYITGERNDYAEICWPYFVFQQWYCYWGL